MFTFLLIDIRVRSLSHYQEYERWRLSAKIALSIECWGYTNEAHLRGLKI